MFGFEYIIFLSLLGLAGLALVLYFLSVGRRKRTVKRLGDADLVAELTKDYNKSSYPTKFFLMLAALVLLVLAFANPRVPIGEQNIVRNGIDVVVALDVSKSMLASDVQPTRLERAKQMLSQVFDKMQNNRIGLVVFAGKAYVQMPISTDVAAAKMYLSTASPDMIPTQGTALGSALAMSNSLFNPNEKKYKSIILVTDGEDHEEYAENIAKDLRKNGVVINTVGIGSLQGANIVDGSTGQYKTDAEGKMVVTKLNQEMLEKIAKDGNGIFLRFDGSDQVSSKLAAFVGSMDKRPVSDASLNNYQSLFQWFAGLAFLLLVLELLVSEVKKSNEKRSVHRFGDLRKKPLAMLFALLATCSAFAQANKEAIRQGNGFYENRNYPAAANAYQEVLKTNLNDAVAWYNLGNAFYKGGKKDDAIKAYEKASHNFEKVADVGKAFYNKGVVLQNTEKLDECIAAYKNALRLNQNDSDARHNLQLALKKKQEQNQKNDNNKGGGSNAENKRSSMQEKDAENKLKALAQHEKNLQDKLHKVNAQSPEQPEKDW